MSEYHGAGGDTPPPMPRWVKVLGLVLGAIVVIAVLVVLLSGGEHGPWRHGAWDWTDPSGVVRVAIGVGAVIR